MTYTYRGVTGLPDDTDPAAVDVLAKAIVDGMIDDLVVVVDTDARLTNTRTPTDGTVTDTKIATTLSPSKITGTAVVTADSRLSDTRTPTDGTVTDAKIVAGGLAPTSISGTAVVTADSRLTNTRTPSDGSVTDAKITASGLSPSKITGTAVITTDSRLADVRVPSDSSVTDTKITPGGLSPSKIAGTAVITTDSRLSNARTPTAHAASHGSGQSDAITIAATQVTGLDTAIAGKANIASPTFTGTVTVASPTGGSGSVGVRQIFISTGTPTTQGADGDIWIQYTP